MRINLSFKDAKITQISESEFKIVFDLSSMNTPRISPDARMYIEHFNLCEFRDEAYGEKGNLRGYFELRCQNLSSTDWNSEDGNSGNCILYRSPLTSFNSFTNNDPMFISNFKINQGFLSNNLIMFLKFFDQKGEPYTVSSSFFSEINENSLEYTAHSQAISNLDTVFKEKEPVVKLIEDKKQLLKQQQAEVSNSNNILRTAHTNLFDAIDRFTKTKTSSIRGKIRVEGVKLLLATYSINDTIYTFETINTGSAGYASIKDQLKAYYQAFVNNVEEIHILKQLDNDIGNLQSNKTKIFENFDTVFDPVSALIKSDSKTNVAYKVNVPTGTDKEGTLDIQYFNAPSATTPKKMIVVDNIFETIETLNKNDILEIDKSIFESIVPQDFTYRFVKDSDNTIAGMTFTDSSGASFNNSRKKATRFSLEVVRSGTSPYTITFTNLIENENDGFSSGFEDGDEITIDGTILDGLSANDFVITIPKVITYNPNITVPFPTLDDGDPSKGTVDIEIDINNTGENDYTIKTNDFSNTSNFKIGDEFLIKGSLINGGIDGSVGDGGNDCILQVNNVIRDVVEYTITDTNTSHSIPKIEINKSNSTITKSDGTAIPSSRNPSGSDYSIEVSSFNGTYVITYAALFDSSSGFENDDLILVDGTVLTGVSGTNNLKIKVQANPAQAGKITTAVLDTSQPYTARKATGFDFRVYVKNNISDYVGKNQSDIDVIVVGNDFQVNDTITVIGTELGGNLGAPGTGNDLVLTINSLTGSPPTLLGISHTGTPNNPTGNVGEILQLVFKEGKNRFFDDIGEIDRSKATKAGSGIDITTIARPTGKIQLVEDAIEKSIDTLDAEIKTKRETVINTKNALVPINKKYITSISKFQKDKIKCMHMSMILYDEIPEYTQSSYDAITANTYSRIMNCQFKRI